jgi:hypothetical protein
MVFAFDYDAYVSIRTVDLKIQISKACSDYGSLGLYVKPRSWVDRLFTILIRR